jgi:TonB family protein
MKALFKEEYLFREAIAASVALHLLMMNAGRLSFQWSQKHQVEIDITNMGHMGGPRPPAPAPAAPAPKPVAPPKEWTKPADDQKVAPAPIPTAPVPQAPEPPPPPLPAEIGINTGDGRQDQISKLPQLLNLSDLSIILQKFYPEKAREEGRQATVVMDIHIGQDGKINAVEVVQSGDPDFEAAAIHVAQLLRFKAACVNGQPVAVKMRQAIQFKLER